MFRTLLVVAAVLILAGCRCGDSTVSSRFGELVVVQVGATGRDTFSRDATVTLAPVFMSTQGTGEVLLRNVGLEEITIASVTRLEGDAALTLDDAVGLTVAAGADANLTAQFAAPQATDATLAEVTHRARFALALSGARAGEDEVLLELVAVAVARDCFVPSVLDFGQVPLRQAVTAPLLLENGSTLAATALLGPLTGADAHAFFLDVTTLDVPAGGRAELPVRFSPLEERAYTATFSLRRSSVCPEGAVVLKGEGNDLALSWQPTMLAFGRLPLGTTQKKQVTIVSNANVALSLTDVTTGGDFSVTAATATVPARGSAVLDVSCTPTTLGPLTADLTFTLGTTPPTVAHVPLSCTGGGPRIRVDPSPLQFGQVPLNLDTQRRIIVQNVGTAPPAPGDPANNLVLGTNGALPWFAIVPRNTITSAADFSVARLGRPWDPAIGLPAIAGENFAEFEVTLNARTAGLREADLLVYSNDANQPVVRVPITATGRLPEQCDLAISPAGADFGATPRGAVVTRTITLTNQSAVAGNTCLVSGIEMAPGSNPAFLVTEPSQTSLTIPRGQSKTIRITASVPGTPTEDYLRGTLRLRVGAEPSLRTLPVDLQVSHCLVVDPPLIDLGVVQTNCSSASKAVTVYNVCGLPIQLSNVSVPAAPFRITGSPFTGAPLTLSPAQQVTITVAAAPTSPGSFLGSLTIDSVEAGVTTSQSVALRASANAAGQAQETFTQGMAEVDILLVVDNSCSMADEQAALSRNFAAFISSATQALSAWHIGVITTDALIGRGALIAAPNNPAYLTSSTPNVAALFSQKVQVGTSGSGEEQPFETMSRAVTAPNLTGVNVGFLRTDASLAVVIITDALEQSTNSVGSYVTTLRRAKGNRPELVSVSVVGPFTRTGGSCITEGQVDDGRFSSIISQTGGVRADICTADWATDLETISRAVFGSRRTFELTGTARNSTSVTVLVDGVPATNWTLDNNAVAFTTAPPPGATISIDYVTACF